ncbi:MAG: hypothetical protein ABI895_30350 [Deltaproteobacteria bacterium]
MTSPRVFPFGRKLPMFRFESRALAATLFAILLSLSAGSARADTVILKDGKRLEGTIKVQEFGKYVVIVLANGAQKTVMWDDLKEIEITAVEANGTGAPAAAPEAPVQPSGPKPPKYKKTGKAPAVGAETTSDRVECSENEPACRTQPDVRVQPAVAAPPPVSSPVLPPAPSAGALKLDEPNIGALPLGPPRTGGGQLGVITNFVVFPSAAATTVGMSFGLDYRLFTGPPFPDEGGGGWNGFFFDPTAQLTVIDVAKTWYFGALLDATAGFQWIGFAPVDPTSHEQGGFGVAAGVHVGTLVPFGQGGSAFLYGGVLSVILPKYTPATRSWASDQFNLYLLNSVGGIVILIGGQRTFG